MLFDPRKEKKAVSTIEYIIVIVMFIAAILLMHKQISRSFFGRWKDLGNNFGQGEQYDPHRTTECGRYVDPLTGGEIWYWQPCYECCIYTGVLSDTCENQFSFVGGASAVEQCRIGAVDEQRKCCAQGCASSNKCDFDI